MNEGNENHAISKARKIPFSLRSLHWSESMNHEDIDVPNSPRTPRTSTTPGKSFFTALLLVCE